MRETRESLDDTESGFTLLELIVAMGILIVFTTIFLTAMVNLLQGTVKVQTTAESATGVLTVYSALDRQIRYADAINFPGDGTDGNTYVEFRVPAASTKSGVTTCYQWRFVPSKARLEARSWQDVSGASIGAWGTKLTGMVDTGASDYPFALNPAGAASSTNPQVILNSVNQHLILKLKAGSGNTSTEITTRFVARNSSTDSPSNADANNDKVSDSPVCLSTGTRS